ncbi:proteinase-activated receptor 3-like [Bolinopsis microptera]|uniref:proteinase-activated receptor 3-like n=1 Tax=Bolinopsis microptera TaxID=2820187 RepID=UPI003078FEC3
MVVFIQYIALADIFLVIFTVLPEAVSLALNRWVFGKLFCRVEYCVTYSVLGTFLLLIVALSLTKLLILKYPFRAVHLSTKIAHFSSLVCFICSFVLAALPALTKIDDIYFSYLTYTCQFSRSSSQDSWFLKITFILIGLVSLISLVVVMVSNVMIIITAKKITARGPGGLQWRGVMTVVLTVAVFTVANLPGAICGAVSYFVKDAPTEMSQFWHFYFFRIGYAIGSLNLMSNFYIYTLSLNSFREFLNSRMATILAPLGLVRYFTQTEVRINSGEEERQRLIGD